MLSIGTDRVLLMASVCACMKYLFVKFYHDLINWKMPKGIMKLK